MNRKKKRDREADLEKEQILSPEIIMKRKNQHRRKILLVIAGIIIGFFVAGVISFEAVRAFGKANLKNKVEATGAPVLTVETEPIPEEEKETWKDGWVRYKGKTYAYNEDIMTFLFMGIDKNSEAAEVEEGTNGGQADALFLAVMNPHKKSIQIIGINRNTMTDVDIYNEQGAYVTTTKAQIAVQHGFGNGVEESCEYQKKAVSKLFYNLPIHGYAAINMSAIGPINDAVGGVDVDSLESFSIKGHQYTEGEEIHLEGETAFYYVKYRDINVFGSADMRLARQKQYLNAFVGKAKQAAKADLSIVADLYDAILPMMTTDITLDEALYLAPVLTEYQFDTDSILSMEGETVQGEIFEEFYADETALYELILNVFYEEVIQ